MPRIVTWMCKFKMLGSRGEGHGLDKLRMKQVLVTRCVSDGTKCFALFRQNEAFNSRWIIVLLPRSLPQERKTSARTFPKMKLPSGNFNCLTACFVEVLGVVQGKKSCFLLFFQVVWPLLAETVGANEKELHFCLQRISLKDAQAFWKNFFQEQSVCCAHACSSARLFQGTNFTSCSIGFTSCM